MTSIPLDKVKKDNSNIRKYSDSLWRALRKERFKPAQPDALVNQMAAEAAQASNVVNYSFDHDLADFIENKLTDKEADVFRLFVYGGRITQTEIANLLGICQANVANTLRDVLQLFKDHYYTEDSNERTRSTAKKRLGVDGHRNRVRRNSSAASEVECREVQCSTNDGTERIDQEADSQEDGTDTGSAQ